MGKLLDTLIDLAPPHDEELREGYHRYEALLSTVLTHEQLETYADSVREHGAIRIFEELTPDELATLSPEENVIATAVMADEYISMENRRVAALLNQRGQHEVAPDLVTNARVTEADIEASPLNQKTAEI